MNPDDINWDTLDHSLEGREDVEIISLYEAAQKEAQDTSNVIESGYQELDNCMRGGFREGDFTVISGIPGHGKTTLGRMFTLHFASKGIPSLWFTHEMTNRELWDAFEEMGADTNLITHVPAELESDLEWTFRHMKKAIEEKKAKAIFIDTLGDLEKRREKGVIENYATILKQMCKQLRDFAIQERVMMFVIAHATKQTRSNTSETTNADIADSNGIAATATNIFHVWRDAESDMGSFVKIGKSRRDGTKMNWKFTMKLVNNRLLMVERKLDVAGEDLWRQT